MEPRTDTQDPLPTSHPPNQDRLPFFSLFPSPLTKAPPSKATRVSTRSPTPHLCSSGPSQLGSSHSSQATKPKPSAGIPPSRSPTLASRSKKNSPELFARRSRLITFFSHHGTVCGRNNEVKKPLFAGAARELGEERKKKRLPRF